MHLFSSLILESFPCSLGFGPSSSFFNVPSPQFNTREDSDGANIAKTTITARSEYLKVRHDGQQSGIKTRIGAVPTGPKGSPLYRWRTFLSHDPEIPDFWRSAKAGEPAEQTALSNR